MLYNLHKHTAILFPLLQRIYIQNEGTQLHNDHFNLKEE